MIKFKKLKVKGFKSFVEPTEIIIENGLTGIVGPNGCGKSNIVDAIKWCLGEQSAKSLRGQVMGDVIFNGTATEKPSDFVEVSLIFNRGEREFKGVFQGLDEVQVTRRLHRNGQSAYLLNHSKVRLKDVQLFFMDTGLYNHRYALIEQGQIGHIIEAKPSQMRLLFEEAAGISHFNESRQSAEVKLHSTQENLDKVQIIVDGLQKQLRALDRQAKKAVLHKRLTSRVRQLSLAISIGQFGDWAGQRAVLSEDERHILQEEEQCENANKRQWNMLVQAKQSLSSKQDESNLIQRQLQQAIQEYTEQQISLNFLNQRKEDLNLRIIELQKVLVDIEEDELSQTSSVEAESQRHLGVENQMKEASQRRSIAIDQHKSATQAIRNTDEQITSLKSSIDSSSHNLNQLSGEITASLHRITDIENDIKNRTQEAELLQIEMTELLNQKESGNQQQQAITESIDISKKSINAIQQQETLILEELKSFEGNTLVVNGVIEKKQKCIEKDNTLIYNFMTSKQLQNAINESEIVLSRSGYTTIMDLAMLEKKAFFIPTPGQFEQEYLAKRLSEQGFVPYCSQEEFTIKKLKMVADYSGLSNYKTQVDYDKLFSLFKRK